MSQYDTNIDAKINVGHSNLFFMKLIFASCLEEDFTYIIFPNKSQYNWKFYLKIK